MRSTEFFKHCPVCGGDLIPPDTPLAHPTCTACGFTFYQNAKPTTGAYIFNDAGELLLVTRAVNPRKGLWDIPGGFMEEWETAEESVVRELKEELGITVDNLRIIGVYSDSYVEDYEYATLNLAYVADWTGSEIIPDDDVSGYQWFPLDQLPWEEIAFPWIRRALEDLETKNRS